MGRHKVEENASYAKYEVYAYSDEKYLAGTETFENQEGEIVTEAVYKNDVLDNLVFTGIPQNGKLTQTISIPSYYDKLYIRRNDNLKYNASIENITYRRRLCGFSLMRTFIKIKDIKLRS